MQKSKVTHLFCILLTLKQLILSTKTVFITIKSEEKKNTKKMFGQIQFRILDITQALNLCIGFKCYISALVTVTRPHKQQFYVGIEIYFSLMRCIPFKYNSVKLYNTKFTITDKKIRNICKETCTLKSIYTSHSDMKGVV